MLESSKRVTSNSIYHRERSILKPISRRDLLRLIASGTGALALSEILAACGLEELTLAPPDQTTVSPSNSPTSTNTPQTPTETLQDDPTATATHTEPTASATEAQPSATAAAMGSPDLVVARNGKPDVLIRRAIAALGGLGLFVHRGADVIIKPNICVEYRSYEYAATTNPWVVAELVKMCYEAGAANVRVMDHTYQSKMKEAYRKSGIQEQVLAAGAEMVVMPAYKFIPTDIPLGLDLSTLWLYDDILNADVLINVPIAKHHFLATLTLGMKNLMGVMEHRLTMHTNMGQRLADLNSRGRPTLNVMDATRMLMANGPTGGNLDDVKQMDTVIVSQDIVALDSYTATLFDMQPSDLDYVRAATAMGLGRSDLINLRIEEINVN